MISNDISIKAELVKDKKNVEEKSSVDSSQSTASKKSQEEKSSFNEVDVKPAQELLCSLFKKNLSPTIHLVVQDFRFRRDVRNNQLKIEKLDELISQGIEKAVGTMKKSDLANRVKAFKNSQLAFKDQSVTTKLILEREDAKARARALGIDAYLDIFRSVLVGLVEGNISSEIQETINEILRNKKEDYAFNTPAIKYETVSRILDKLSLNEDFL